MANCAMRDFFMGTRPPHKESSDCVGCGWRVGREEVRHLLDYLEIRRKGKK